MTARRTIARSWAGVRPVTFGNDGQHVQRKVRHEGQQLQHEHAGMGQPDAAALHRVSERRQLGQQPRLGDQRSGGDVVDAEGRGDLAGDELLTSGCSCRCQRSRDGTRSLQVVLRQQQVVLDHGIPRTRLRVMRQED